MRHHLMAALIAAAGMLACASTTLAAQATPPRNFKNAAVDSRAVVTVALVKSLPRLGKTYDAVVERGVGPGKGDVILLPEATASGALLDAATRALLTSRMRDGLDPQKIKGKPARTITIGVRARQAPATWTAKHGRGADRIVRELRSATARTIPGHGVVRATTFVPPKIGKPAG